MIQKDFMGINRFKCERTKTNIKNSILKTTEKE